MIPDQTQDTNQQPNNWAYEEPPEPSERDYKAWRNAAYECLTDAGYVSEAEDFLSCAGKFACSLLESHQQTLPANTEGVYVCADDHSHPRKAIAYTCHLRICPDCAHRDTGRLMHRYYDLIKSYSDKNSKKHTLKKIVLTTGIDLRSSVAGAMVINVMTMIPKLFDELLPTGWRKNQGVLAAFEFGTTGHKFHIHILFYGQFIEKQKLSDAWERLSGFPIVYIKAVQGKSTDNAIAETLKYCTKFWSRDVDGTVKYIDPELVPILLEVLKGTRRLRSYGVFYAAPFVPPVGCCSVCKAELRRINPEDWQLWLSTGFNGREFRSALDLKPGNKSPPANSFDGDCDPPGNAKSPLLQKTQHILGADFTPSRNLGAYQE